ncbi:MAG: VWA domain-containing protein, partial [bacterium]
MVLISGSTIAQDTVPGVRAELVRLDIVVTDAQGNTVPNLTAADFELREDGKVQKISHFAAEGGSGAAPQAATVAAAAPEAAETRPARPGEGRHVAVFVDDLHIHATNLVVTKQALRRFVSEVLAPDDNVALVTTSAPGGVAAFSRDRAALSQDIERLVGREAPAVSSLATQMSPAQAEL